MIKLEINCKKNTFGFAHKLTKVSLALATKNSLVQKKTWWKRAMMMHHFGGSPSSPSSPPPWQKSGGFLVGDTVHWNEWSVSHRCDAADGMPPDKQTVEVRRWAGLLCRHKSHFFPGAQRHKKSMASRTNRLFRWSVKRNFFFFFSDRRNENFFHQSNFPTKKSTKRWTFWHTHTHTASHAANFFLCVRSRKWPAE